MNIYNTPSGCIIESDGQYRLLRHEPWQDVINRPRLRAYLNDAFATADPVDVDTFRQTKWLPPIGQDQEVWAAGVTYFRSRTARMEESDDAGGSDFYDRVYEAHRPELFFKATPRRVVGTGDAMRLRADSQWIVPEPELTLVIASDGSIVGYTAGNDLSCRDIEGENPLYLPQAKTFDQCCALGPCVYVTEQPFSDDTAIHMALVRGGEVIFDGSTTLAQLKKQPAELIDYLFRECSFPYGCLLMTGTGIVPPNDFCLRPGDESRITIDPIETLVNTY